MTAPLLDCKKASEKLRGCSHKENQGSKGGGGRQHGRNGLSFFFFLFSVRVQCFTGCGLNVMIIVIALSSINARKGRTRKN